MSSNELWSWSYFFARSRKSWDPATAIFCPGPLNMLNISNVSNDNVLADAVSHYNQHLDSLNWLNFIALSNMHMNAEL